MNPVPTTRLDPAAAETSNGRAFRQALLGTLLALLAGAAGAAELRVLLVNNTPSSIVVAAPNSEPFAEVGPGASRWVSIHGAQQLRFGDRVFKYRTARVEELSKEAAAPVVLQANTNGRIYVLPKGTRSPRLSLPPQPTGFPLVPSR